MLGRRLTRKNHFKNSPAVKRARFFGRIAFCLKTAGLIALLAVMSFAFILGHDLLTQCAYFRAESLEVSGNDRISTEEIIRQAGIHSGINVLSVNLSSARQQLLAHPWIAEAEVIRELPSTLRIRISENQALAVLDLGRKFLMDTRGDIFKEWDPAEGLDLPVITGLEYSDLSVPGESRTAAFSAVMEILELGEKDESVLPNRLIRKIHVDREIGLTLFAFDGSRAIRLGYQEYPKKYDRLRNLLYYLEHRPEFGEYESIDLINVNRIVVNPVKEGSPGSKDRKEV